MQFIKDYWWLILIVPIGVFINTIKDLKKVNYKKYLLPDAPTSEKTAQLTHSNHNNVPMDKASSQHD